MNDRMFRGRAAVAVVLLVTLSGCQLVKRLTGRGNDAGTTRTGTLLSDAGGASPVIALPNPTVAPLPTTPPPTPPTPTLPTGATDGGGAAATPDVTVAAPDVPSVAVVDGGSVPTNVGGDPRHHGRIDNFCKEHPGRVHPRTGVLCPM